MSSTIEIVIGGLSAFIAIITIIVSMSANKTSKKANNLSGDANEISKNANDLSGDANELSKKAVEKAEKANDIARKVSSFENIQRLYEMNLIEILSVSISYGAYYKTVNKMIDDIKNEHINEINTLNMNVYCDFVHIKGAEYIYYSNDNITLRNYIEELYRVKRDLQLINSILLDENLIEHNEKYIKSIGENIGDYKNYIKKKEKYDYSVRLDEEDIKFIKKNKIYVEKWSYSGQYDQQFEKQLKEKCFKVKNTEENYENISKDKKSKINEIAEEYKKMYDNGEKS